MTPLLLQKVKRIKEPLDQSEKVGLKHNIQKMKIMASGPITSWQIDGETMETVRGFIFWVSKVQYLFDPLKWMLTHWKLLWVRSLVTSCGHFSVPY